MRGVAVGASLTEGKRDKNVRELLEEPGIVSAGNPVFAFLASVTAAASESLYLAKSGMVCGSCGAEQT